MSYQAFWIIKHRVLYNQLAGDITLDDFRGISKETADLITDAYTSLPGQMVIGVIDIREANLGQFLRLAMTAAVQNIADVIDSRVWKAKSGFVILITTSQSAKVITGMVIRLSAQPMTTVATLDEALTVVSYMYPELQAELNTFKTTDLFTKSTG